MKKLTDKEKLLVFQKLSIWCQKQRGKSDAELVTLLNKHFSPTTFSYLYEADALKTVRLAEGENQYSDEEDSPRSRANTVESVHSMNLEVQTDSIPVPASQTQTSPKRKSPSSVNDKKRSKVDKTESVKKFLKALSLAERPEINHSPMEDQELQEVERCDEKDKLVEYIKKNLARLKSHQLDQIQIRILIAKQFKKLRELFGSRRPNKEFEEYFKEKFDLAPSTFRYHINYLELLEKYRLFQQIPHFFTQIRNQIGSILDWLDSDEAKRLPSEDITSQSYWKKCPPEWQILPSQILGRNVVTSVTTFVAPTQHSAPPSPPTDESISRSLSSISFHSSIENTTRTAPTRLTSLFPVQ
jgi:hypothetical protein